jgi:tetratricopeptide (TPR) repeat protein
MALVHRRDRRAGVHPPMIYILQRPAKIILAENDGHRHAPHIDYCHCIPPTRAGLAGDQERREGRPARFSSLIRSGFRFPNDRSRTALTSTTGEASRKERSEACKGEPGMAVETRIILVFSLSSCYAGPMKSSSFSTCHHRAPLGLALICASFLTLFSAAAGFAADDDYEFKQGSLATQADRDTMVKLLNLPGSVSFKFNFVSPDTFKDPAQSDGENASNEKISARITELKNKLATDGADYALHNDLALAYSKLGNKDLAWRHTHEAAALLESKAAKVRSKQDELMLKKNLAGLYLSLMSVFQDAREDKKQLYDKAYSLCAWLVGKERSVETLDLMATFYFFAGDVPRAGDTAAEAYNLDNNSFDALSLYWIIEYFKIFGEDIEKVKIELARPVPDFLVKKPLYAELVRHIARTKGDMSARRRYESLQVFIWFFHLSLKAYLLDPGCFMDFIKPLPHFTQSDYELLEKSKTLLTALMEQQYLKKPDGLTWSGMLAMVNGDLEGTISSYEKLLYLDPSSDTLNILVYLVAQKAKNYARAHTLVDYKMSRGADTGDHLLKGSIYFFEKKYDKAASCMEQALARDRGNGTATLDLAIINLNRNRLDDAGSLFSELEGIESFEFKDRLYAAMAVRELLRGKSDIALGHLKKALRDNPGSEPAKKILNEYYTTGKKNP